MGPQAQTTGSSIRQIAVSQSGVDIFATAEFEENVTLWSLQSKKKVAKITTVLDFGGVRLAVIRQSGFCSVFAASFYGPVNAYDLEGHVLWSRRDLVGVQQLAVIPSSAEPLIGVGSDKQPYRILNAIDGRQLAQLNGIKRVYSSFLTRRLLALTQHRSVCLTELHSTTIWEQPLRSFGALHGCLSSEDVAYSETGGAIYCCDFYGRRKWVVSPEESRHFVRVGWNCAAGRWMAVDWNYSRGGPKRVLEIDQTGTVASILDLREPAEVEFFPAGDRLVTSDGDVLDTSSGKVIWDFWKGNPR